MSQILNSINEQIKDGKFYEAQQMYKGLVMRYAKSNKLDMSCQLAVKGIRTMFQQGKAALASELGVILVRDVFDKTSVPLDQQIQLSATTKLSAVELIEQVIQLFPESDNEDDQQAKITFIKTAVKWSANAIGKRDNLKENDRGAPQYHFQLAKTYQARKEYKKSNQHFLKANNPTEYAQLIFVWAQTSPLDEYDLFITRAVLQLLATGDKEQAKKVLEAYLAIFKQTLNSDLTSPLINFDRFLLLAAEKKNYELFSHLEKQYEPALSRDSALSDLLKSISAQVFGVKKADNSLSGMLNQMLGSFMGPQRQQSRPQQQQPATATNISLDDEEDLVD